MHLFHHEICIVDKAGECPGKHFFLPIDGRGVGLDNESGVCAGNQRHFVFKRGMAGAVRVGRS